MRGRVRDASQAVRVRVTSARPPTPPESKPASRHLVPGFGMVGHLLLPPATSSPSQTAPRGTRPPKIVRLRGSLHQKPSPLFVLSQNGSVLVQVDGNASTIASIISQRKDLLCLLPCSLAPLQLSCAICSLVSQRQRSAPNRRLPLAIAALAIASRRSAKCPC